MDIRLVGVARCGIAVFESANRIAVEGASGFEVRYKLANQKKWSYNSFETKKNATKYLKKLKKGKKYHVSVRAFVKSGTNIAYSSWTAKKKVKVK